MLAGLAGWVIVGHSERRRDAGETDELIGRKLGRAVDAGLRPILCVGEQLEEREAGRAIEVVDAQLRGRPRRARPGRRWRRPASSSRTSRSGPSAPAGTPPARMPPRWPTRSARRSTRLGWGERARPTCPILYGGSVTSANIGEFLAEPSIDGALVGGASLKPDEMAGIVARAGLTARARAAPPRDGRPTVDAGRDRSSSSSSTGSGSGTTRPPTRSPRRPMPTWRGLLARWPHAVLGASEGDVGLPAGPDGQLRGRPPEPRCRPAGPPGPAADRRRDRRRLVLRAARRSSPPATGRSPGSGTLHLVSLIGPGGVHANDRHLVALAELGGATAGSRASGSTRCSTGATRRRSSALEFVRDLERRLAAAHPDAADRDRSAAATTRWTATSAGTRTERGYDAIVHGEAVHHAPSATAAIEAAYARGETDEFVAPTVIDGTDGRPVRDGDAIIHANFRADRARQLTHALVGGASFDGVRPDLAGGSAGADGSPRRDDDRVRGGAAGASSPSRPRSCARSPTRSPRPAGASSTSPRPRSTPTSRTSSTAASRTPHRARIAAWSRARRSRPTTSRRR